MPLPILENILPKLDEFVVITHRPNRSFPIMDQLLQKVGEIDPEAGAWLRDYAAALPKKELQRDVITPDGLLISLFSWSTAPQGVNFWYDIYIRLKKGKK